ncbi:hypothetical protein GJ744_006141 [Endocarpon pusillum]|uniref:DASH complex subunit DAD3 n=1 Tax=Endocarpon pusillum TaxID=364733 RepID=A0A8H7ABQ8_9EURO|nr:hypothetical protein GJ744_006141 [Endocarpon pusillum]
MEPTPHAQIDEHGLDHLGTHLRRSDNVSPLEQEVLDEYARLARNMERLSITLTHLTNPPSTTSSASTPSSSSSSPAQSPSANRSASAAPPTTAPAAPALTLEIAESLRLLERKVASVYTLLKASVYSIVLQQGEGEVEGEGDITQASVRRGVGDNGAREGVEW